MQALNTLVAKDGHTPTVEGFFEKARPLTTAQLAMLREYAASSSESTRLQQLGAHHWVHDVDYYDSLVLLESKPTINIEGLVAGYTGPGGKTVLPHRAVAKIDIRLVPDMTTTDILAKLKAHLARHGFADLEVNMSGGYNPTRRYREPPHPGAARHLSRARHEAAAVATLGGLLAGVCVHRCATEPCGRALRSGARYRRTRA